MLEVVPDLLGKASRNINWSTLNKDWTENFDKEKKIMIDLKLTRLIHVLDEKTELAKDKLSPTLK